MNFAGVVLAVLTAVHLPVTTSDPTAQALFDRALFFYYAFDGGDAAVVFASAAARDPRLAMAYWGEALAAGPDLNTPMTPERFERGQIAIERAVALENGASSSERRYIDALALRYKGKWTDWDRDEAAYRGAMLALVPASDPQRENTTRVLAAEALLERDGADRQAVGLVNAALASDPENVMANHLCIHLNDRVRDATPARVCATRLDAAAFPPQAEHLAHMPAHYWIESGEYAAALASSDRAAKLFAELQKLADRDPDHDRYLSHEIYVGYSAAMMLGNYATAQNWASRTSAAYGTPFDALTALRFQRFPDAYARASGSSPSDLAIRGYAALAMGRTTEAHDLAERLRKTAGSGYLAELFFARLAESDGNVEQAERWIDRAAGEQRDNFAEELIPLLPALEARGGLALRQKEFDAAAKAFRATLDAYPNDPRALLGLATALEALGQRDEAAQFRTRFEQVWKSADTTISPLEL